MPDPTPLNDPRILRTINRSRRRKQRQEEDRLEAIIAAASETPQRQGHRSALWVCVIGVVAGLLGLWGSCGGVW